MEYKATSPTIASSAETLSSEWVIKAQHLKKSFLSQKVIDDISFNIKRGTFYALLGENGAGKSTLLRLLMGIESCDAGTCTILGQSILEGNDEIKNKIALVSEALNFDVPANMDIFLESYKKFYNNWDEELFRRLILERKIDLHKKFKDYSRGQKMQLALVAALSVQPEILLIDEITSVLDIYARRYFINLLHQFTLKGGTVILTTNIITEVQYYATDLMLLNGGKIQIHSPIQEIPKNFMKLKKNKDEDHDIFHDPHCYWAGINADFSTSYIAPLNIIDKYSVPEHFCDSKNVQLDDVFIYYINGKI